MKRFSHSNVSFITIIQAGTTALAVPILRVLSVIDVIVQRLAATFCLSSMPFPRARSQSFRRQWNRVVIGSICLFLFFATLSYRQRSWSRSKDVPILGAQSSELFLYFPPVGGQYHPKVAEYNVYKRTHPRTPLFVPFTRNNTMLQQAVLSYIAAGWPRSDIVVIDNSGTMDANNQRLLSPENPFFLDYELFRRRYGVAILQTPTLLNFAQLQNFLLRQAVARDWQFYFWSHMDIAVLSAEDILPYKSFYHRVLDVLDTTGLDQYSISPPEPTILDEEFQEGNNYEPRRAFGPVSDRFMKNVPKLPKLNKRWRKRRKWATKFFDFDNLALVNVEAWRHIGPWDVFIPYYNTDCDAYARITLNGYRKDEAQAGYVFDIASVVQDPEIRFFPAVNKNDRMKWGLSPSGPERAGGELGSQRFEWLKSELQEMMDVKNSNEAGRNTWQGASTEGTIKPRKLPDAWSYDAKAFQTAWWAMADYGRAMYIKKWGTLECDLSLANKTLQDAWLSEYLVEGTDEYELRIDEEDYWNGVLSENAIR
jgi:hypothetical protein